MNALTLQLQLITRALEAEQQPAEPAQEKHRRTPAMRARMVEFAAYIDANEPVTTKQLAAHFGTSYISARWTAKEMQADGLIRQITTADGVAWRKERK